MNEKKAKAIRKDLRAHGVDPKGVDYRKEFYNKSYAGGRHATVCTLFLAAYCGRAIYHRAKAGA